MYCTKYKTKTNSILASKYSNMNLTNATSRVAISTGTDFRVGLVVLGPGPPHFGGPTKSILLRFYIR